MTKTDLTVNDKYDLRWDDICSGYYIILLLRLNLFLTGIVFRKWFQCWGDRGRGGENYRRNPSGFSKSEECFSCEWWVWSSERLVEDGRLASSSSIFSESDEEHLKPQKEIFWGKFRNKELNRTFYIEKPHWWLMMMINVVFNYPMIIFSNRFEFLSNDNGFLSYLPQPFSQRTLLARFPLENSSFSDSFFIKKPIYNFFTLQSNIKGRYK